MSVAFVQNYTKNLSYSEDPGIQKPPVCLPITERSLIMITKRHTMKPAFCFLILGLTLSIFFAAAAPANGDCPGTARFFGTVLTPEEPGDPGCFGNFYVEVTVDQVLWDDCGYVSGSEAVSVGYDETLDLQPGQTVEVFGDVCITCPFMHCGMVETAAILDPAFFIQVTGYSPYVPTNPSPGEGASGIGLLSPVLSWTGGDPDSGDTVIYDFYFGRSDPPKLKATDLADTTYVLGNLNCYTTYYSKIVARDNHGAETEGPLWSFTTTDADCPVIETLNPNPCNPKQVVTITGRNFGDTKKVIRWGSSKYKKKKVVSWTDSSIDFKIKAYNKWLPGTSKTKDLWFKVGPAGSKIKSNRMPLTITKP
jgi:hypothetical protein